MYRSPGVINDFFNGAIIHSAYITSRQSGGPIRVGDHTTSLVATSSWGPHFNVFHRNIIDLWLSM